MELHDRLLESQFTHLPCHFPSGLFALTPEAQVNFRLTNLQIC